MLVGIALSFKNHECRMAQPSKFVNEAAWGLCPHVLWINYSGGQHAFSLRPSAIKDPHSTLGS